MKKSHVIGIIAIIGIFIIFLGIMGASTGSDDIDSDSGSGNVSSHYGSYNYELYPVESFIGSMGFLDTPDEGNIYVVASITLSNNNYKSGIYTNGLFYDLIIGDTTYGPTLKNVSHPEYKELVQLGKGASASYIAIFTVPETSDYNNAKLVWSANPKDVVRDTSLSVPKINAGNPVGSNFAFASYNYDLYNVSGFTSDSIWVDGLQPNTTYIVASITLRNNAYDDTISTGGYHFKINVDGVEYSTDSDGVYHPEYKDTVSLSKGGQYSFIDVFEVPKSDLSSAKLVWTGYPDAKLDESLKVPKINAGYDSVLL